MSVDWASLDWGALLPSLATTAATVVIAVAAWKTMKATEQVAELTGATQRLYELEEERRATRRMRILGLLNHEVRMVGSLADRLEEASPEAVEDGLDGRIQEDVKESGDNLREVLDDVDQFGPSVAVAMHWAHLHLHVWAQDDLLTLRKHHPGEAMFEYGRLRLIAHVRRAEHFLDLAWELIRAEQSEWSAKAGEFDSLLRELWEQVGERIPEPTTPPTEPVLQAIKSSPNEGIEP